MKISLTMPTRDRPYRFIQNVKKWISDSVTNQVQYLFLFDKDQQIIYKRLLQGLDKPVRYILNEQRVLGCHKLVNRLARQSSGDIIVTAADDMWSCPQWDKMILQHFKYTNQLKTLIVNDGYQNSQFAKMMVLPIMTRKLFQKIGYVYYQGYKHLWADSDIFQICKLIANVQYDPNIFIQHRHPSLGKAEPDKFYNEVSTNMGLYFQGQKLFNERKNRNFDLELK